MTDRRGSRELALNRQQQSLHEIIESINSELALRPLLTRIVQHVCELLEADRGSIGLVDFGRNVIRTEAVYHMPPDELGVEMAPGVGLADAVWQSQQPIILNRYGDLERPLQATLAEDAVIGRPIFWRERMIAFFGIGAAPPASIPLKTWLYCLSWPGMWPLLLTTPTGMRPSASGQHAWRSLPGWASAPFSPKTGVNWSSLNSRFS